MQQLTVNFEMRKIASFEHILISWSALMILLTRATGRTDVPGSVSEEEVERVGAILSFRVMCRAS